MLLTILDVILILIMLVSGFLALMRGFTREVLSIASWGVAAIAAFFAFNSSLKDMVLAEFNQKIVAYGVLLGGVFLVTLILVGLITARISDAILDSRIGALDRSAGFIFGLLRGLIIVVIGYFFFDSLVAEPNKPAWVREARSRSLLESTGKWVLNQLPDDPEAAINSWRHKSNQGETGEQPREPDPAAPATTRPPVTDDEEAQPEEETIDDLLKNKDTN